MADINQLISNFYDQAVARDFARDISFRITQIQPDPSLGLDDFTENDLVYVKAGKVPGRNITNIEAKYMGLTFNIPGVVEYPNSESYTLEFYCDRNSTLREKFEKWSRAIFNDANSTGNYSVPQKNSYIQLAQLNPDFTVVKEFKLVGVSVRSVGELEYSIAEGTGAPLSFSATIAYHYYEIVK
jgi:hypothetical protein